MKRPVAIDLFSGAGGLSEGLLAAGFNVAIAIEKHPHAALTCAFNHPSTTVICDNIANVRQATIQKILTEKTGGHEVDLIAGGPPCQGFSSAGSCDPKDPRNSLFKEFVRIVEELKPAMILFENVPGFTRMYGGKAAKSVARIFKDLGYQLHGDAPTGGDDYKILDAISFGVPQRRKRFVMIGIRRQAVKQPFEWPSATHDAKAKELDQPVSSRQALEDLSFLKNGMESHGYQTPTRKPYPSDRRAKSSTLFNHLATNHRSATRDRFKLFKPGCTVSSLPAHKRTKKQTMGRLDPARPSRTVLALPDDIIHYKEHRIPTVREMARLQSFDDDFVFLGKRTTSDTHRKVDVPQYTQVGNAVPPLLAKALGTALLRCLGHKPKDLRQKADRRKLHRFIRGSSAYAGYSLAKEVADHVILQNADLETLPLPISADEPKPNPREGSRDWTKLARTKRWRPA